MFDPIRKAIIDIEDLKMEKRFDEALKILKKMVLTNSDDYRIYEEIADIYLYLWNIPQAEKAVNFALSLNNNSSTWNYLKWFILLSNNKPNEAIRYLEKSNNLTWNNSEVLRNLWWAYTLVWKQEKWIMILKRALNLSPWDELITEDLAIALIWIWKIKDWNILLSSIWKNFKNSKNV